MTRSEAVSILGKSNMKQEDRDALLRQFDERRQGATFTLYAMRRKQGGYDWKQSEWYKRVAE